MFTAPKIIEPNNKIIYEEARQVFAYRSDD